MPVTRTALCSLLILAAGLSSCRRHPDRVELGEHSRAPFEGEPEPRAGLGDHQRFAENMAQQLLDWKTPEGWTFVTATEFRHINFVFGPERKGECYLTVVTGAGGGLLENFNRWRGQLGLLKMTEEEIATLPTKVMLGRTAPFIDVTAPADPATGTDPKSASRLVGTIFQAPGALFTIKMTGPADLLEQNLQAYDAFLKSLAPGDVDAVR